MNENVLKQQYSPSSRKTLPEDISTPVGFSGRPLFDLDMAAQAKTLGLETSLLQVEDLP